MISVKNLAKYCIIGLLFLSLFTPLFVSQSLFFPFITSKNFFFRIVVELAFGLWAILALFDQSVRPKRNKIFWLVLALAFVTGLSTFFGANSYRSFWSNFERMEGFVTTLHLTAYFIVLVSVLNTKKIWDYFLNTSLGISAILVIYGFFQLAGKLDIHQSGTRLDATLGNASYLGIYMLVHTFLSLFLFFRTEKFYRWIYIILAILQGFILYNTATRGSILGFLGGITISGIILAFASKKRRFKVGAVGFLALIIVFTGIFWSFRKSDFIQKSPVLSRFSDLSFTERTVQSRFFIWKLAWEGSKERPILGWGPENFNLVFNKYYEPILYKQEVWFDRAHNIIMDRLSTTGFLGLGVYLSLFGLAMFSLWRKNKEHKNSEGEYVFSREEASVLTGLLLGYFFHNLFVFDNITSSLIFYFLLAYIAFRTSWGVQSRSEISQISNEGGYSKYSLALVFGIITLFIIYVVNVSAYLTSKTLIEAFGKSAQSKFDETSALFQKAIAYESFGTTESREHFSSFAFQLAKSQHPSATEKIKQEAYSKATSQMAMQVERTPNDIRYLLFLATLQNGIDQYEEGIKNLVKAIEISPKKQILLFELASAYINQKNYPKAVEIGKKVFELEPSFEDARKIYAIASIYNGDVAMADSLFMEIYKKPVVADQRLINAYIAQKKYDRVVQTWEVLVEQNPGNVQYRVSLAASYYLFFNRTNDALKELEMAKKINPSSSAEIDRYITQIRSGQR